MHARCFALLLLAGSLNARPSAVQGGVHRARALAPSRRCSVVVRADAPGAEAGDAPEAAGMAGAAESVADDAKFAVCSRCGAIYDVDMALFRGKGAKVRCTVCSNTWFQLTERLVEKPDAFDIVSFPEERRVERPAVLDSPRGGGIINIYVGNMPFALSDVDLANLFAPFGTVTKIMLVRDEIGRSKGFGFVEMASEEEGQKAILELNDRAFGGRPITVAAREMRPPVAAGMRLSLIHI